jgi:lipopolysaccharide/colanic/teichoic acid biosynthesis glycosyltransferase
MDGKRLTDVVVATVALVGLAPILLLCGLAVRLLNGPPVLYRQERMGRGGRPFRIAKFRSMRVATGGLVTVAGDARITRLGRILRRWKLDELPQLWNVLVGEMSLVGPRPEVPQYVARYPRSFRALAALRPGITDWSSLIFRDEEQLLTQHATAPAFYEQVLLPRKLALGRLYHRCRSGLVDARILLATLVTLTGPAVLGRVLAGRHLVRRARCGIDLTEGTQ